ncbi:MAG TPA: hypothetical protein VMF31_04610 [Solirubrobacterales bacterium]|nr:hypothetical protein [Solirubrobacterales bacterium]
MKDSSRKFPLLVIAVAGLMAFGLVACGGGSDGDETARPAPSAADFPSAEGKTIEEVYNAEDPSDLVIAPASLVFDIGKNRYPFGVFEVDQTQVDDAEVALYFAKSPQSPVEGPLPARVDSLETKPAYRSAGVEGPGEASTVYVVDDVNFNRKGPWLGVAVIDGENGMEAARLAPSPVVGQYPNVVTVGDKAPKVSTPTADSVGGDLSKIDTRQPPSSMHNADLKDVLGKKPVVLIFATPALCQSRVCGPVVDVTEQVKDEVGDGVEFIHMEVYENNTPPKLRPQLGAFGLQSEPMTYLIGKDGIVKERIEGAFGVEELKAAVERLKKESA